MSAPQQGRRLAWVLAGLLSALALSSWSLRAQTSAPADGPRSAPAAAAPLPPGTARAIVAGGCFWCVESDFDKLDGVISTTSGYLNGTVPNPTYEQVSSKRTGHVEAVEVIYDTRKLSYDRLLAHFWRTIDPTTLDRQFCDVGSPYRTGIYPVDAAQMTAARSSKAEVEKTKPFPEPIVTEIVMAGTFYPAEGYHQDYYKKNPVRYQYYRSSCGRDARLKALWGAQAVAH